MPTGAQIDLTPLKSTFTRRGLRCNRMHTDSKGSGGDKVHQVIWVVGDHHGAITLVIMLMPDIDIFRQGVHMGLYSRIGDEIYFGIDIGRHTPQPLADYDREYGPHGPCVFLDGLPCYYDGTGIGAADLLRKAVAAGDDDMIWDELIEYHKAWITERDDDDIEEVTNGNKAD